MNHLMKSLDHGFVPNIYVLRFGWAEHGLTFFLGGGKMKPMGAPKFEPFVENLPI